MVNLHYITFTGFPYFTGLLKIQELVITGFLGENCKLIIQGDFLGNPILIIQEHFLGSPPPLPHEPLVEDDFLGSTSSSLPPLSHEPLFDHTALPMVITILQAAEAGVMHGRPLKFSFTNK